MFRQLTIPSLLKEGKKTAVLAVPLVIGQVSQMLMIVADTVMVGNVGVTELAALSFANAVFAIPFVFGIGLITSISVLSSGAAGRKDEAAARATCRNGFYLALASGLALFLLSAFLIPFLSFFGQPANVTAAAPPYLFLILISLVPALGSMGLKNHGDSLDHPWPSFFIFLGGVLLNIALNQLFIFNLGYGLVGAGWATLISRITILVASGGILRGLEDVTMPAWTAVLSYWFFGIPLGWLIATKGDLGPIGVWWGLAIGLTVASIILTARVFKIAR